MECTSHQVPKYLDRNNRKPHGNWRLFYFHKAYRDINSDGNEIDFPGGRINNVSCKWSNLIGKKDIKKVPPFATDYRFNYFWKIFSIRIIADYDDEHHPRKGRHVLSCKIIHTPDPCNFSHIEILISHQIFNLVSGEKEYERTYSREDWENRIAILNQYDKNKFFKELRKTFRIKLTATLSKKPAQNTLVNDSKAIFLSFD